MRSDVSWIKLALNSFKYLLYLFCFSFILIEVLFRILPVSDSYNLQPVNKQNPIYHFAKNREVIRQSGFSFRHIKTKKINNYGYASDKDYLQSDLKKKNLVAVIGDSYVEASQVKNIDTFHSILDKQIENLDVYPIGASGAALSQYLAWADFAKNEFNPDIFVFLIIDNDFDKSWYGISNKPGFHFFKENGDLHLVEYSPSKMKKLLRKSAFIRYLYLDLKITHRIKKKLGTDNNLNKRLMNTELEIKEVGNKAIDLFLKKINQLAKERKVILMLDGDRTSIYKGRVERDKSNITNRWFTNLLSKGKAQENPNLYLLDLQPFFAEDWDKNKKFFEYRYDAHWNERGHSVAGKALADMIKVIEK
tara:strand:- start:233 stop:1321 length:1089 start_codon:yes stop_codon:yes gene_type:complete